MTSTETPNTAIAAHQAAGAVIAKPASIKDTVIAQFKEAEAGLQAMADRYRNVVYDVATPKGMKEAIAARAELRDDGRRAITRAEKKVKEDVNALKEVMSEEVERLVAIVKPVEDAIDAQIKAQEKIKADEKAERERKEAERVGAHRSNIEQLRAYVAGAEGKSLEIIKHAIDTLNALTFGVEWEEFAQEAQATRDSTVAALRGMVQHEEQRIENELLRAQLAALQPASAPAQAAEEKPAETQDQQAQKAIETVAQDPAPTPFEVDAWDEPCAADPAEAPASVPAVEPTPCIGVVIGGAPTAPVFDISATMTLGQLNTRIAPIKLDASNIEALGFAITRVKAAVHFPVARFPELCAAIARRAMEAAQAPATAEAA